MSVHQTTDGRWFVRYPKGKNPQHPERTREYYGRGQEAEAMARHRNRELGLGKAVVRSTPLFSDLVNGYLAAKIPAMAEASRFALKKKMEKIILPRLGHHHAQEITPELLDRYVANRRQTVKTTTVHRDLCDIRAVLRWAVRRRYLSANPMEAYTLPARDNAVIKPPTVAEVRAILNHAAPWLARAIVICYYTGLRAGQAELLRLTWNDINLDSGHIFIVSARKGGIDQRTVPIMDQDLLATLTAWRAEDEAAGKQPWQPVITYRGKPVRSLKTAWTTAKRAANITRRLRLYDLRHSFATKLLDNGADLKHVSSLLGHKSVQQTVDTYQHLSRRLTEEAVQKLPSILTGNPAGHTGNTGNKTEKQDRPQT